MNVLEGIYQFLGNAWNWLQSFFGTLVNSLHDLACALFKESLNLTWSVMGAIPIPTSLSSYSFPDPGTLGPIVVALGVPQAFAIIAAAFTIKLSLKLVPLIFA